MSTAARGPRAMIGTLPRAGALAVALVLLAFGAAQLVRALAADAPTRARVISPGPATMAGHAFRLIERPGPDPAHRYVDVQIGARTLPGEAPLWVDTRAAPEDYARRYAGRYEVFAPRDPATAGWLILEIDHAASDASEVGFRSIEIAPDGGIGLAAHEVDGARARPELTRLTLGGSPPQRSLVPAPVLMLGAAWLALHALWRPRHAAWPTLSLAAALAALASLVAWPAMLHLGLARTLPAPVVALAATLLVAAAIGPRLQACAASGGRARALLAGIAAATLLLAAFVLVQVNVAALVAPVFRPPGGPLTPAQWLIRDFVAPTALLGGAGLPLAVAAGACYGLLCRAAKQGTTTG